MRASFRRAARATQAPRKSQAWMRHCAAVGLGLIGAMLTGCPLATTADRNAAAGASGTSSGAGNQAKPACGGPNNLGCPAGSYCDDGACGLSGLQGRCEPMPSSCDDDGPAVCGCDGRVYASSCAAIALTGKSRCFADASCLPSSADQITCDAPEGAFACGALLCAVATDYCAQTSCASGGQSYSCKPLPSLCGSSPDCSCLTEQAATAECLQGLLGGLTIQPFDTSDDC